MMRCRHIGIPRIWFAPNSPAPALVRTVPRMAFLVDDLDAALIGRNVLIGPNSPAPGVRVAFIVEDGAPIEFLELDAAATPSRPGDPDD